jgi:hypothetical protein
LGWLVIEGFVQALVVEPRDVLEDCELELAVSRPGPVSDQLRLEAVDEALSNGVIQRVADRADRRQHAVIVQCLGVVKRRVLTPGIGVLNERDLRAGLALMQCHP